ncbi:unnamed protein product, partial [Phaeothamnion confervicola]
MYPLPDEMFDLLHEHLGVPRVAAVYAMSLIGPLEASLYTTFNGIRLDYNKAKRTYLSSSLTGTDLDFGAWLKKRRTSCPTWCRASCTSCWTTWTRHWRALESSFRRPGRSDCRMTPSLTAARARSRATAPATATAGGPGTSAAAE